MAPSDLILFNHPESCGILGDDWRNAMEYNANKKEYNMRYAKERLKRIPLDVTKEHYEEIKNFAAGNGETVNGFIKRAILEAMSRKKDD